MQGTTDENPDRTVGRGNQESWGPVMGETPRKHAADVSACPKSGRE